MSAEPWKTPKLYVELRAAIERLKLAGGQAAKDFDEGELLKLSVSIELAIEAIRDIGTACEGIFDDLKKHSGG